MKIAFLGAADSWYCKDLARAAGADHVVQPARFSQLTAALDQAGHRASSGTVCMESVDAVLVRTMPPGSLEQVVFRMDVLGRLEAAGIPVINPARAVETAVDKYVTTARLAKAGLRVPRTRVCQSVEAALAAFEQLGRSVVMKPLFGSEGRGITWIADEALFERAATLMTRLGSVLYLQEFVPHDGCDLRLLVVGSHVMGIRRRNDTDWRTNVSRGARTESLVVDDRLREVALRAARAVGAPLAGVDLLPGRDGHLYTIEVNAVPGWRAVAETLLVDVAAAVLDHIRSVVDGCA